MISYKKLDGKLSLLFDVKVSDFSYGGRGDCWVLKISSFFDILLGHMVKIGCPKDFSSNMNISELVGPLILGCEMFANF